MFVFDFRQAFLPFDIIRDQVHRSRPVERAQRDDVVDRFEIELFAETGHAAFQLENTDGFGPIEEGESCCVIDRNLFQRKFRDPLPD